MADLWLPGWERLPGGDHVGDMRPGSKPKLLLHKTQSPVGTAHRRGPEAAFQAVLSTLSKNRSQPHLVYDPSTRRKGQYIPLNRAGAALANDPGGVETNRGGPIQVEILGYSEDSPSDPDEWIDNLAADVAAPVCRLLGIPVRLYKPFVGPEAGFIAREDAPQRMPLDEWYGWAGILAHQNAPENEHWDVGRYKGDRLIQTTTRLIGGGHPIPDPEDDDMPTIAEIAQLLDRKLSGIASASLLDLVERPVVLVQDDRPGKSGTDGRQPWLTDGLRARRLTDAQARAWDERLGLRSGYPRGLPVVSYAELRSIEQRPVRA